MLIVYTSTLFALKYYLRSFNLLFIASDVFVFHILVIMQQLLVFWDMYLVTITYVVTLEGKEKGGLKAKRSWLVRVKAEGTLVTSAKQHKLASD